MLAVENIGEFGKSILICKLLPSNLLLHIEIFHAIRVKVSDPVNLVVYVGEKVRKEVRLNFK